MSFRRIIQYVAAALSLAACSIEPALTPEEPEEPGLVQVTFPADSEDTKTCLGYPGSESTSLLWSETDHIAVYDGTAVREFSIRPGTCNGKTAIFEGLMSSSATSVTAVYPYSGAVLKDGVLSAGVPAEQTASAGTADPAALVATASGVPGGTLTFKNQCAVLLFSVGPGVSKVAFLSDNALASDGSRTLTVNLSGTSGTYAAAIAPGNYPNFRAVSVSSTGAKLREGSKSLSIKASQICRLGSVDSGDKVTAIFTKDELSDFLSKSTSSTKDKVVLLSDIDCSSSSIPVASGFGGILDGFGHTVKSAGHALFATNSGTLRNFKVSGSEAPAPGEFASVATNNSGTIEGVVSGVSVNMSYGLDCTKSAVLGGIVAYNSGTIRNCRNSGTLKFNCSGATAAVVIGGVAAYSTGAVIGCENSGTISFDARTYGAATAVGSVSAVSTSIGGIVGLGYTGGTIDTGTNSGTINYSISAVDKVTASTKRNTVGGIAGNSTGNITNSHNRGALSITSKSSTGTAFSEYGAIICAAGICGADFYASNQSDTSIKDCTNSGNITADFDASLSYSTFAGIFGWPGKEATGITSVTSGCTNSGSIVGKGFGKGRFGGIQGGTGNIDGCTNTGNITVVSSYKDSAAGGIAGFHSQVQTLNACTSKGNVISQVEIASVGGLIGLHGNLTLTSCESCVVDCDIQNVDTARSGTGMVVGRYNGTSAVITSGSSDHPVDVKGTITFNGVKYTVTGKNFKQYLTGTANESSNHTVYAVCSTAPQPGDCPFAEGYVSWSDGSPAVGITVSDGFQNAITDDKGYYFIETCPDTWYIYFSYPSNAKITKNSDGCPDFYKRYSRNQTRYDFTLVRQAVEKDFAVFALADPQAHYESRGSAQISADVIRFNNETVPALNAQIAKQSVPCYAVTLGDITYSEGSRNSNPGMPTMRTYMGKVNMPVFQSMGNHDFTYFKGDSNPLKADATSSTWQIKAQRKFEECFGPINLSFNRGDVHFVCMRDIYWTSTTDAATYHGGFTDEQFQWLKGDLENVPTSKKVILCVHIPLVGMSGKENVSNVCNLLKKYTNSEVFSGHTHYKRGVSNVLSSGMYEHVHSAVCGQWWWSNIEGDGCPNGFTVYKISGTKIVDEYFSGTNKGMDDREYQMRVYRGNIKTGGSNVYFQWPYASNVLLINVFNIDSRWKSVKVYENGVYTGTASLMSQSRQNLTTEKGKTYDINTSSSQDWWAIGWNMGVVGRGIGSSTSYQTTNYHLYKYTLKNASATVKVEATDPYGRVYTCAEVIENGTAYPAFLASGNH